MRTQILNLMMQREDLVGDIADYLKSVGIALPEPTPRKRKEAALDNDDLCDEADGSETRLRTAIKDTNPANWAPPSIHTLLELQRRLPEAAPRGFGGDQHGGDGDEVRHDERLAAGQN